MRYERGGEIAGTFTYVLLRRGVVGRPGTLTSEKSKLQWRRQYSRSRLRKRWELSTRRWRKKSKAGGTEGRGGSRQQSQNKDSET